MALSGHWLVHLVRLTANGNQGALTICLHAGGNPASVRTGRGLPGCGCSVDSLNQKSSSPLQPSPARGGAGGLHSVLSAGQPIWTWKCSACPYQGRTL